MKGREYFASPPLRKASLLGALEDQGFPVVPFHRKETPQGQSVVDLLVSPALRAELGLREALRTHF